MKRMELYKYRIIFILLVHSDGGIYVSIFVRKTNPFV